MARPQVMQINKEEDPVAGMGKQMAMDYIGNKMGGKMGELFSSFGGGKKDEAPSPLTASNSNPRDRRMKAVGGLGA